MTRVIAAISTVLVAGLVLVAVSISSANSQTSTMPRAFGQVGCQVNVEANGCAYLNTRTGRMEAYVFDKQHDGSTSWKLCSRSLCGRIKLVSTRHDSTVSIATARRARLVAGEIVTTQLSTPLYRDAMTYVSGDRRQFKSDLGPLNGVQRVYLALSVAGLPGPAS